MLNIVKLLVENGASLNGDTDNVDSCLIEAVRLQDLSIVEFFLNNGANVNHQGIQAMTALHVIFMQYSKSCTCKVEIYLTILIFQWLVIDYNVNVKYDEFLMIKIFENTFFNIILIESIKILYIILSRNVGFCPESYECFATK